MDAALFDRELDAKGMNCPLPILKTKKALFEMDSGQVLRVLATDPGATGDFEAFARQTGNALISSLRNDDGVFVFHFRRK
ncbi:MAG: sulfurtransferase TusA family protein [Candidatus Accumulibacter sp.]|nr:sulfurtransferase TusA family protein [Accumulibacter sp.]